MDTLQRLMDEDLLAEAKKLRSFLASIPPHQGGTILTACRNVRLHDLQDDEMDGALSLQMGTCAVQMMQSRSGGSVLALKQTYVCLIA